MIETSVFSFKYNSLGGGSFSANGRTHRQHLSNPKSLQQIKQWFIIGGQVFDPLKSRTQIGHKLIKGSFLLWDGLFYFWFRIPDARITGTFKTKRKAL